MIDDLDIHLVQSRQWGEFKQQMGAHAVAVGEIQFTKHKIPFSPFYVGYAPKVNFIKQKFSWQELKDTAANEQCLFIRFDVPNILRSSMRKESAAQTVSEIENRCVKSPRSTFTKHNVLLDISPQEEKIIANFTSKTRYNSRLASKKGVTVKIENNEAGLKIFNELHKIAAKRQHFLPHSEEYYTKAFNILYAENMANILVAYFEDKAQTAWMLLNYKDTLYYPYGGSISENRSLMASNLMAWEAIKLGKKLGCRIFDMWGATNKRDHPYWGFTKFKLGYGGELVEYIDSYDFVASPFYYLFNLAYGTFWKLQDMRRKV